MIANFITISRILLSIVLLFIKPFSISFFIIYSICGISDMIDGTIARKMKSESKFGAKLDSIADLVMMMVLLIIMIPKIITYIDIINLMMGIAIIRIISIIIVFKKYKKFGIIHTYANKLSGFMLFFIPFFVVKRSFRIYAICIICLYSAIEELIINIRSNKFMVNRKTIFQK